MTRLATKSRAVGFTIALAMLVAAGAQTQAAETQQDFVEIAEGVYVVSPPDPVAAFRLVTQDDRPFDNISLRGKWSFLFFGFTYCPDICPTTLATFADMHRRLAAQPKNVAEVQFIMVSVDPERDTPHRLKQFLAPFPPGFIGLTGDAANLARLSESVGARYAKAPGPSEENYLMHHSSAVLLTDPHGRLHAIFAAPHTASNMVQAFLQIRAQAKQAAQTEPAPGSRTGTAVPAPPR